MIAAKAGWNEALLDMFRHVDHVYKWGIYDRDPLPEWTRGRVTLLGDAAHPTMPTLAQGANMAIEDGYVLARNLARHAGDLDAALKAYVAERQPRTSRITLQSRAAIRQQPQGAAAAVPRSHLDLQFRCHARGNSATIGMTRYTDWQHTPQGERHGFDREIQRPLLEGRRSGERSEAL